MKKILIQSGLLITNFFIYNQANANCTLSKGFTTVDIPITIGTIVVRPNDPVGTVLQKNTFTISPNNSTATCNRPGDQIIAALPLNYPISPIGNNVYATNIPGIGIRIYREATDSSNSSGYYPYKLTLTPHTAYTLSPGYIVLEVIKTAATTGSGALVAGRYSTYYVTGQQNRPFLTTTVLGSSPILIASSSCEIQNGVDTVVELPTVTKSGFRAIGTTQGEKNFNLSILCNGGENNSGIPTSNTLSLSFDYNSDAANSQVISNSAAESTKANGVGVELLWNMNGANSTIQKGNKLGIGTIGSNQTVQYDVPLTARYYQTAANVTAGEVKANATVTIQYD
ncbi:TPA: fimbrial protein [Acinetobacter nosocomialis]|uniref:Fimbrial protein n=1 Tax=Acinetobacter nosocomialis TaxID=106654 RepID=A0AB37CVJ1_ACINO|nr:MULTISPECIES: fimbrial protein [Acinetobacter calcoaceticus/baumannii complex]ELW83058.1 fimbrial protein [Acinetobacter sp. OIFC021]MBO8213329.1 fimbrial protein [Acinetobacter nosocomialis]MBP1476555.1 fimbrial protein [Acinetobacter nosocomialis]MBP1493895.1 fimbrial protein [Acinetobacter nosocomialis]MBR7716542.1 fimbrial protein [Acinetobacter nosocomialis]